MVLRRLVEALPEGVILRRVLVVLLLALLVVVAVLVYEWMGGMLDSGGTVG